MMLKQAEALHQLAAVHITTLIRFAEQEKCGIRETIEEYLAGFSKSWNEVKKELDAR